MKSFRKPEVKAIISVNGEHVKFISLKLDQEMSAHHHFELLLDHQTFDEQFFSHSDQKLKLVNSKVIIDLQHGDDAGKAYVFSGIVTHVRMIASEGDHGAILLTGSSLTIELERNPISQTYSKTDLTTILREVTGGCPNLSCEIIPAWKADIDFSIQYQETDWSYLRRICKQYNERYYFTGLDLYVGPHPEFPVVNLIYDEELTTFEMCSRLRANQYAEYFYQRETHTTLRQDAPGTIEGANNTLQQIGKRMDRLNADRRPNTPVAAWVPDMGSLIEQGIRRKVSTGADMMYVRGIAKTCDVRIGRLISVRMPKTAGGADMGTYRVYKVTHELDQNGRYHCDFEALPADLEYLPTPEVPIPVPNPIECEVIRNEDPLGLGRIQVQWPFDERPCSTWIPTMTPDAGGNGAGLGPVSRGYSFVSEVGDSVLVSFLDENLSSPFVLGSMFHGVNAEQLGGGWGNHIKTITDKSGGQIMMNTREKGGWGITIHDVNGNKIYLNTAEKNINIHAPEKIIMTAKNILLSAEENVTLTAGDDILENAGKNMSESAGETHTTQAKNKNVLIEKNTYTDIKQNAVTNIGNDATVVVDENINVSGGKMLVDIVKADMLMDVTGKITLKSGDIVDIAK